MTFVGRYYTFYPISVVIYNTSDVLGIVNKNLNKDPSSFLITPSNTIKAKMSLSLNKKKNVKAEKQLNCCDCKGNFPFPEKEAAFFKAQGFSDPTRCLACRGAKKAKHVSPLEINCSKCHSVFIFTVNAQKHFKEQGWAAPIRCFDCRKIKKAEHEAKAEESKEEESAAAPLPLPALPPSPPSE